MKIINVLLTIAFFTASFDTFLTIQAGGTIRIAQVVMLLVMVAAAAQIVQTQTVAWPVGGSALALWCVIQGFLLVQSDAVWISFALYVVLVSIVLGLFATIQLYGRSNAIHFLMKIYLMSFVFVACFGLLQLVSPALHLGAPLVVQWIKFGLIPRINGFSYEPSYFATYLLLGWATVIDLRTSGARLTQKKVWGWIAVLLSAVLILSTSKTAWLVMVLEGLARLVPLVWRTVRAVVRNFSSGRLLVPLPKIRILVALVFVLLTLGAGFMLVSRVVNPAIFLAGTGFNHSAAHSVTDRVGGFEDTLTVIHNHFWIGPSLGGVPAAIATMHGDSINSVAELRMHWGFPVPVEVFAASGLLGFIPFAYFLFAITAGQTRLIQRHWEDERAKWLHALIRAFFIEAIALMADQNLLRIYLWFHVTMMMVVAYNLRYRAVSSPGAALATERLAAA